MINQPVDQPLQDAKRRDRGYDPKFDFTEAQMNAAGEIIRTRQSGPASPSDTAQWSRETFQAALKAACKAKDNDNTNVDVKGNVRPTPQPQPQKTA